MNTEGFKHKLTAILSADVQGYSRLMEEDEESTVRTLTAYRKSMSVLIEKHKGRVVDSPGDNLLAEFDSLTDAVHCAVEIQEELRIRNADLPEDRKMQFRIGINLGEIIEDRDQIYGDGINVAARVEGLADGGGICISGAVYDAIKNKLSMSYEFMGEHNVKNIKEPIRIYRIRMEPEGETAIVKDKRVMSRTWQWAALVVAVFILGAVVYIVFDKYYLDRAAVEKKITATEIVQVPAVVEVKEAPKTIAVLPFVDLSPEKDQEYFADGISEEILNTIAQIPDLNVSGRTSSFSFKNSNKTAQEIAEILGVENILEGSVRKAGNILRITAQLLRAKDGFHLWSKSYDKELKDVADIFSIQEDIATAVANELKLTLGIGKSLKQLVGGTDNLEAYELYLIAIGTGIWPEDLNSALESIDAAIDLDPEFALAWARKAMIHQERIGFLPANKVSLDQDAGLHAAQKAIELEPNLAYGYFALGQLRSDMGDWIEAELALREARKRVTEPSLRYKVEYPLLYWFAGHLERSKEMFEESMGNDPFNWTYRVYYIFSLSLIGDMQHAEEQYKLCRSSFGDNFMLNAAITVGRLGSGNLVSLDDIVSSESIFNAAKEHLDSPKEGLAELHKLYIDDNLSVIDLCNISLWAAYFGDPEFAMDALEKSSSLRISNIWYVWFPIYKEVRQTSRFKELFKEIGLVDYWNEFGWPDLCRPLDNGDFECD